MSAGNNLPATKVENLPINHFFSWGVRSDREFGQAKRVFLIYIFEFVLKELESGKSEGQVIRLLKKEGLPIERARQLCSIAANEPFGCGVLINNLRYQFKAISEDTLERYQESQHQREMDEHLEKMSEGLRKVGEELLSTLIHRILGC
jgi:hypothetical protein